MKLCLWLASVLYGYCVAFAYYVPKPPNPEHWRVSWYDAERTPFGAEPIRIGACVP